MEWAGADVQVEPSVQKLYDYIYERGTIHGITEYNHELLLHGDVSKRVTESIRCGTDDWEALVCSPIQDLWFYTAAWRHGSVCDRVESKHLLGCRGRQQAELSAR